MSCSPKKPGGVVHLVALRCTDYIPPTTAAPSIMLATSERNGWPVATNTAFAAPLHASWSLCVCVALPCVDILQDLCGSARGFVCMLRAELPAWHDAQRPLASCSGRVASRSAGSATMLHVPPSIMKRNLAQNRGGGDQGLVFLSVFVFDIPFLNFALSVKQGSC